MLEGEERAGGVVVFDSEARYYLICLAAGAWFGCFIVDGRAGVAPYFVKSSDFRLIDNRRLTA